MSRHEVQSMNTHTAERRLIKTDNGVPRYTSQAFKNCGFTSCLHDAVSGKQSATLHKMLIRILVGLAWFNKANN